MELYNEDCLEGMKRIPDGAVDMILTDLPYGVTAASFDVRIPFEPMWEQFKRVTKRNAAIVLFANGRFLIELAASNLRDYRYKWVWEKALGVGFLNAKKMPLRCHEDILVFYKQLPTYNPQYREGKPYVKTVKSLTANYGKKLSSRLSATAKGIRATLLNFIKLAISTTQKIFTLSKSP